MRIVLAFLLLVGGVGVSLDADAQTVAATAQKCGITWSVNTTTVQCTLPGTTTDHAALVCGISWLADSGQTLTGLSDSHHTYTARASSSSTASSVSQSILDAIDISVQGTMNITATFSANVLFGLFICQEFTGVKTSGGFDVGTVRSAVGDSSANNVTTGTTAARAQANSLLVGMVSAITDGPSYTAGSGFTEATAVSGWGAMEYRVFSSSGTDAATWTDSVTGQTYIASAAVYKDATAGGGGGGGGTPKGTFTGVYP